MTIEELKTEWKRRIYVLTEQIRLFPPDTCECKLIKEERETLIKCLDELNQV